MKVKKNNSKIAEPSEMRYKFWYFMNMYVYM